MGTDPALVPPQISKPLCGSLDASSARRQFTLDLLPADSVGAVVYHAQELKLEPNLGSIFNNLILADEINRTPAKV